MNAEHPPRIKGRHGLARIIPRPQPGDDWGLLSADQASALLASFDVAPDVTWRWIYTSIPIGADGSLRLTLQGALPTGEWFIVEQASPDFSAWAGFHFMMFGIAFDQDPGFGPRLQIPLPDQYVERVGPWNVVLLYRHAFHPESPSYIQITWSPGEQEICAVQNVPIDQRAAAMKIADRGFDLLELVAPRKRGPERGTAKNQHYRSKEQWHAALLVAVRANPIQTRIKTQIGEVIAGRLGISATTVRRNLDNWGPKTPEELLNGKFDCECHGCRG